MRSAQWLCMAWHAAQAACLPARLHRLNSGSCSPACRYQAVSPASTDLDRRPPRPSKESRVRLFRTRRWEAYVAGFSGFATPPRWGVWDGKADGLAACAWFTLPGQLLQVGMGHPLQWEAIPATPTMLCTRWPSMRLQPSTVLLLPPCPSQVCVRVGQAGAHADLAPRELQVGHRHSVRVSTEWEHVWRPTWWFCRQAVSRVATAHLPSVAPICRYNSPTQETERWNEVRVKCGCIAGAQFLAG